MVKRGAWRSARWAGCAAGLLAAGAAWAAPGIYSCIDANGKRLTSDRPIVECSTREQRLLNPDGSVKRIVPPTLTADERAEQEARERQAQVDRAAQKDATRRDRNLMARFPDEATHNKARAAALDDVHASVRLSERRLAALAADRKPLMDEAEFYAGRQLPHKLRQLLDANDAATEAQRSLIQNQQSEMVRINALYDAELARLRRLWAGAPAGSMGALSTAAAASAAKPATIR
ncbi:hypothetical protein BURC_01604 [Burkholderiaceae bacterium]|nr:hypothetical protein BURC_01604 [Burkholderiaceae bacterium]